MAYPSSDIDSLINKTLDTDFVERSKRYNATAERSLANSTLVGDMTSQMFALNVQMVNAAALNQLPSGLPDKMLGFNASAGQPFNSPGAPGSANPAAPKAA